MYIENDLGSIHDFYLHHRLPCSFDLAKRVEEELIESGELVPEVALYSLAVHALPLVSHHKLLGKLSSFSLRRRTNWEDCLIEAVREGDIWGVATALDFADPTVAVDGGNLLHLAVPYPGIVIALIDAGANLHEMNNQGKTPLDLAEEQGFTLSALHLLANGAKRGVSE